MAFRILLGRRRFVGPSPTPLSPRAAPLPGLRCHAPEVLSQPLPSTRGFRDWGPPRKCAGRKGPKGRRVDGGAAAGHFSMWDLEDTYAVQKRKSTAHVEPWGLVTYWLPTLSPSHLLASTGKPGAVKRVK